MSLILTGNSSTLTVDSTNGITYPNSTTQNSAGAVLQLLQTYYKTTETLASNTWTATGLSATITPKFATSKIFVMVTINASTGSDTYGAFKLYRNGAEVTGATSNQSSGTPPNSFIAIPAIYGQTWTYSLANNYLDSPATTSAQTYTLYWARTYNTGTLYMNRPATVDTGNTYTVFAPSSITLMEVAG